MQTFTIDHRSAAFDTEMRQRLAGFFRGKKRTGNYKLYIKAFALLLSLFSGIVIFSTLTLPNMLAIPLCVFMGFIAAGIGFNIMHDAVHRSFSLSDLINLIFSYSLNLLGGYWPIWKAQHNVDHHMNTNINGLDGDIDFGIFARLHPGQIWKKWHRYQYIYLPLLLYPLSYLGWIYLLDFIKAKKLGYKFKDYCAMVVSKLIHMSVFIGLPLLQYHWTNVIIGYLIMTMVTGVIISFVFQLAHVVEKTEMLDQPQDGKVRRDVVHQLRTTADFARHNKILTWYVGGLNYQIEHHLYYAVSHVHYPAISKDVKVTCEELDLPYHEYQTLGGAILSHIKTLKKLGQKP